MHSHQMASRYCSPFYKVQLMEPMKGSLAGSLENGQHGAAPRLFIWLMGKLKAFIVALLIHVLLTHWPVTVASAKRKALSVVTCWKKSRLIHVGQCNFSFNVLQGCSPYSVPERSGNKWVFGSHLSWQNVSWDTRNKQLSFSRPYGNTWKFCFQK